MCIISCFTLPNVAEVKIIPTLIAQEQKAKNLPAAEMKGGEYVATTLVLVAFGFIILLVVLDLPSLFLYVFYLFMQLS